MMRSDFRYYAAFELPGGGHIGDVPLDPDWIPALRWAEFEQDVVNDCMPGNRSVRPTVVPVWSSQANRPYVGGVSICRSEEGDDAVGFPLTYFSAAVIAASGELVASGALVAGQRFDYKVFALPDTQGQRPPDPAIKVVAIAERPAVECTNMAPFVAAARSHAGGAAVPDSLSSPSDSTAMPIFVPQQALNEATELAQGAGDVETGGVLVGKLCRGSEGQLFCRVTAQIPARHTTATRQSLRFTPDTWVNVDAAIKLRGRGEVAIGWWHSHPWFCVKCAPQQRAICPFSSPAFSAADRHLHREVFQTSWSIALLLSFLGDERPSYDVFAWNKGQIQAVDFYTLPESGAISGESPCQMKIPLVHAARADPMGCSCKTRTVVPTRDDFWPA